MKHTRKGQSTRVLHLCTSPITAAFCIGVYSALPAPAFAQYPDTYMVGRGVLRMSFEPEYLSWRYIFDTGGIVVPLGTDLSFDSTGANFYPTMSPVEAAIWSITGDGTLGTTAGAFDTQLHADVRRFPFNFRLGLHDRLTFTASIPVVTTRMQVSFAVDSSADVGWNQVSPISGGEASAVPQITDLLGQLEASAAALDAIINSGGLDCPAGPQCENARSLVTRARRLASDLIALTGVDASGNVAGVLPPFAPVSTSAAGLALASAIETISGEFQALGAPAITESLPLPLDVVSPDSLQLVLSETTVGFGYDAQPLDFAKYRNELGDLELGLRLGVLQSTSLRAVLSTTVRLPTGTRDAPDHYVDIGTGDKQTDVETGLDVAFEPGSVVGIALSARYNLQLGDQLVRRLAPSHRPIALAAAERTVSRDLGDVLTVAAYPTLRLNQSFRAYGAIHYYRKQSDTYTGPDYTPAGMPATSAADLGLETSMRSISLGAGIHFRSTGRDGLSLPAEAGVYYHAAYQGSGGFTPKTAGLTFYLRLFRRFFGGPPAEPEAGTAAPVGN